MTVRVRFAPSPTGMLHVGGVRSALQNWIYAKQHHGVLVLRIEDTDAARNRPEWTDGIVNGLAWIGITPEEYEGPYFQSSYEQAHTAAAGQLFDSGRAYYCDCVRDQVQARTGSQYAGYDGFCRDRALSAAPAARCAFVPRTTARPWSST